MMDLRSVARSAPALTLLLLCSCQVERTTVRSDGLGDPWPSADPRREETSILDRPVATPVPSRTTAVTAAVQPRGTIPYEVTCSIGARVRRIYVDTEGLA